MLLRKSNVAWGGALSRRSDDFIIDPMITRSKAIEGLREVTDDIKKTGAYKKGLLQVIKGTYKKADFFWSAEWVVKQVTPLPQAS